MTVYSEGFNACFERDSPCRTACLKRSFMFWVVLRASLTMDLKRFGHDEAACFCLQTEFECPRIFFMNLQSLAP